MKRITVSVNLGNQGFITCPYCQKTSKRSFEIYRGAKHAISVKCSCEKQFTIELNFRQFYRKPVHLLGELINLSSKSGRRHTILLTNLSMSGLGFKMEDSATIREGHRLQITFTLDNKKAITIEKKVEVIDINNNHYGCQFLNPGYAKELGFYLRS